MSHSVTDDPTLRRFKSALDSLYGDRIERAVLFGSRARGDAHPNSDFDIAVFLNDMEPGMRRHYRLADLGSEFLDETGIVFEAWPLPADSCDARTPPMPEIRKDGIAL
jgi:predicted nucleotidyltransferase